MFCTVGPLSRFDLNIELRSTSTSLLTTGSIIESWSRRRRSCVKQQPWTRGPIRGPSWSGEAKDYRDVAALLDHGIPLEDILGSARALFGPAFSPLVAQKALCYFKGGDLESLEDTVRARLLAAAAHDLVPSMLHVSSPRLD
jgi:hypothetical protein